MAANCLPITEQWIRERLNLQHSCLADVRSLCLPGTYETGKICNLGISLKNFVRLKILDLSHNALVSVEGIVHLHLLETLNLYYNKISSLQDVLALRKLTNLNELDLRLNPVVKQEPSYRLYLVYAITKLRKLDDCAVRDRERKAALMYFSVESAHEMSQKPSLSTEEKGNSEPRIASVRRVMMRTLAHREGNEETVLNHKPFGDRSKKTSEASCLCPTKDSELDSVHSPEIASEIIHLINDCGSGMMSSKDQESKPSIRKRCSKGGTVSQHAPRVTFLDASATGHSSASLWPKTAKDVTLNLTQAEGSFTPHPSSTAALQDRQRAGLVKGHCEREPNPVLHPPRLTYRRAEDGEHGGRPTTVPEKAGRSRQGTCEKPMELLLSLVEEYWCGRYKDHDPKHFLTQAVRILRTMEQEVLSGEQERKALREKTKALKSHAEQQETRHQSQIQGLTEQLQKAHSSIEHLDQQLRTVLEENVSLQKELITLEQRLFSERLRQMPDPEE
ncbi:centrosomal protein of 72 kDa isoform X2 [Brachyhypopomus gauderio]|uniref:centrosomal protein of 72 kDa isoform X2 n=1 Tax=Brachyhypopomus gauderio TaxID=698409 RepID=UPI004041147A